MHARMPGAELNDGSCPYKAGVVRMVQQIGSQYGGAVSEHGQALIETMLVVPFVILLSMVLAEFGIYFYRANMIEDTTQQMGRMAARNATHTEINSYMNSKLSALSPTLTVYDTGTTVITTWTSNMLIEVRVSATVAPVMPVSALNIFTGGTNFFPTSFSLQSKKQVFVE